MLRTLTLFALATFVLAPVLLDAPGAEACRPMSWICPLNGKWYTTCGGVVGLPPVVQCANDTVRGLTLP